MKLEKMFAREVLDSRGRPTVEVEFSFGEHVAIASVPSGKSTGSKEALEKRDSDGRGVDDVLKILNDEVFPKLTSRDFENQRAFDEFLITLDGTENKSRIGANGVLAMSIAWAKLSAMLANAPLWRFISESEGFSASYPRLYMNVLNGGAHADFRLPFQEYIVVVGGNPKTAYERAQYFFTTLGDTIRVEFPDVAMGDEGGYSPSYADVERPFAILRDLIRDEHDAFLAIDSAASEFFHEGKYHLSGKEYTPHELLVLYQGLVQKFPLRSIEDPFEEHDANSFAELRAVLPKDVIVMGDDLTVTNPHVLKTMIDARAGDALIIKPNQIGTLTEVYDTVRMAHSAGWKTVVSHRSGETLDSFIADLAVGVGAYGLKAGAPSQRVRAVKYERLVEIEREWDANSVLQ